jgi:hypothetical protein
MFHTHTPRCREAFLGVTDGEEALICSLTQDIAMTSKYRERDK